MVNKKTFELCVIEGFFSELANVVYLIAKGINIDDKYYRAVLFSYYEKMRLHIEEFKENGKDVDLILRTREIDILFDSVNNSWKLRELQRHIVNSNSLPWKIPEVKSFPTVPSRPDIKFQHHHEYKVEKDGEIHIVPHEAITGEYLTLDIVEGWKLDARSFLA